MTYYTLVKSPIGQLLVTTDGSHITRLYMEEHQGGPTARANFQNAESSGFGSAPINDWLQQDDLPVLQEARKQLDEFFAGRRTSFDLPLKPEGSEFQRTVWHELTRIPFGKTISYGELARRIGKPDASRAVGLANGKNPIAIVVPCHRVIGASGMLTGYGGGIDRKKWLLEHEGIAVSDKQAVLAI